ncbi:MAG: hypothetical protein R3C05_10620 [Pirellulaceae bacterium]
MSKPQSEPILHRRCLLARLAAISLIGGAVNSACGQWPSVPRLSFTFNGSMRRLPRHDYQHKGRSPSIIAGGLPVQRIDSAANTLLLQYAQSPINPVHLPYRKRFRPNRAQLRIDHCRVSDIVLDIESTGAWVMSLVAEQNPPLEPEETQRFREHLYLRRNEFHIEARLLASTTSGLADIVETDILDREPDPGRIVAVRIRPRDFWVQREQPRTMQWHGHCRDVMNAFDDVTSVEFEFYYFLDPVSAAGENVRRLDGP